MASKNESDGTGIYHGLNQYCPWVTEKNNENPHGV